MEAMMTVSIRESARLWGCSYYSAKKRREAGEDPPEPDQTGPRFLDMKQYPESAESLWQSVIDSQGERAKWNRRQETVQVHVDTNLPISITGRGDGHLGNENTDHATFREHTRLLAETEGMYVIGLGDETDGYIKPSMMNGIQEATIRVKLQRMLVWDTWKALRGKMLAACKGQHDDWASQLADFDPIEWATSDFDIPYVGHGGDIALTVGEQEYLIRISHKGKGSSATNPFHSIMRDWRENGSTDITFHADKHTACVAKIHFQGEMRVAARPGSYKLTDEFTQSLGFGRAIPAMPTIILWPDKRRLEVFDTIEGGAEYLSRLRGQAEA